jgi:protein disulfide-isomerase-like protein
LVAFVCCWVAHGHVNGDCPTKYYLSSHSRIPHLHQPTMRFSRLPSVAAVLSLILSVIAESESAVISLTATDFDEKVNPEKLILVEFFAPWCGHCKALAPHYDEASLKLKEKGIPLAKVDCVDQADLCQQHGVGGYPYVQGLLDIYPFFTFAQHS